MRNCVRYWCRKCGDRSYMDMAGIVSPLFALAFAFAFAFSPLATLVIIPLRARVVSALLRATLLLVKARVAALALDGRELLSVVASLMSTTVRLSVPLIDDCILDNIKGKRLHFIVINDNVNEVFPFERKGSKCNHCLHLRGKREMGDIGSSPNCNMGKSLKSGSHTIYCREGCALGLMRMLIASLKSLYTCG